MRTLLLTTKTPGHEFCVHSLTSRNVHVSYWPIINPEFLNQFDRIITLGVPPLGPQYIYSGLQWLNLHGGNPEYYRGLDSYLWAIYHKDWANIMTTLHYIDEGIDTGDIVFQSQFALDSDLDQTYQNNMFVCASLVDLAASQEWLPKRKQVKKGRYYGAMPEELKEVCRERLFKKVGI